MCCICVFLCCVCSVFLLCVVCAFPDVMYIVCFCAVMCVTVCSICVYTYVCCVCIWCPTVCVCVCVCVCVFVSFLFIMYGVCCCSFCVFGFCIIFILKLGLCLFVLCAFCGVWGWIYWGLFLFVVACYFILFYFTVIIIFMNLIQFNSIPQPLKILPGRSPYVLVLCNVTLLFCHCSFRCRAVAIPEMLNSCEKKNQIDKRVTRFVVPFAVTTNADGSALYITSAAVFIGQAVFGSVSVTDTILIW